MKLIKTKVCMNSGREYEIDMHPEEFLKELTKKAGVLTDEFIYCSGVFINPKHISSIEKVEVTRSNSEFQYGHPI